VTSLKKKKKKTNSSPGNRGSDNSSVSWIPCNNQQATSQVDMLPTFQQYPKPNPTATTENHDLDMDFSNYGVAKEQKNSWQVVKKRKRENQNYSHS
jgi:Tfp pilus assembly protein PilP